MRRQTFDQKNNSCFTRTFSPLIWKQDLYLCGWPHKGISGMSITVTKSHYLEGRIGFLKKNQRGMTQDHAIFLAKLAKQGHSFKNLRGEYNENN